MLISRRTKRKSMYVGVSAKNLNPLGEFLVHADLLHVTLQDTSNSICPLDLTSSPLLVPTRFQSLEDLILVILVWTSCGVASFNAPKSPVHVNYFGFQRHVLVT